MSSRNSDPGAMQDGVAGDPPSRGTTDGGNSDKVRREVERRAWDDPDFVEELEASQRLSARPLT